MRGQIENDIHVRLVEPEIQACAVEVEEPPEVPVTHQVTQFMDGCIVLESMTRHEHHAGDVSSLNEG